MSGHWQTIFLIGAGVLILFQAFVGWRRGLARQVARVVAIIAAVLVARWKSSSAEPYLEQLGVPAFLTPILSTVLFGLVIYFGVNLLSSLVLKKTSHQTIGPVRWIYGAGGAVIGVFFGIAIVWAAMIALRLAGTVAETGVRAADERELASTSGMGEPVAESTESDAPGAIIRGLAELKQAMDQGPAGQIAGTVDPVPQEVYDTLADVSIVVTDADRINRFMQYPGAREIAGHPEMLALVQDPEIAREVRSGNYLSLLRHPKLLRALQDPELGEMLESFELKPALAYALGDSATRRNAGAMEGAAARD